MRSLFFAPALALVLSGCQAGEDATVAACTDCTLVNANNFSYTSDLRIGSSPLRAETDGSIRWDTLTRDVRGGTIDPLTDLNEARLIAFRDLDPATVTDALAHDDLAQADVSVYVTCTPTDASCVLSDFGMFGNTIDIQQYFQEGYGTWLLALGKSGEPGADALMFLEAVADTETTEATLTDATSTLTVDVDLDSLTSMVVPLGDPSVAVDWSGLTRDGIGDTLDHATLDELWVARFEETPEELAQDVFSLEELAQVSWTLDVSGYPGARLADLEGEGAFGGIDREGTWLMALRCRTCTNPAPRFVTLLEGALE
ncbi:MAG: hypothetical protein Q8P18_23355 [Pseudomonadota bacterium]|nr:hypothetical protein [Pseudomonadota bacterium]